MTTTQHKELRDALNKVRSLTASLPTGRRNCVDNLCSRISREARKQKPERRHGAPDENPNEQSAPTQKRAILAYLNAGGVLTKSNAKQICGAEDFRKRISELRAAGHDIKDRWCQEKNRYGHVTNFKQYYMEGAR